MALFFARVDFWAFLRNVVIMTPCNHALKEVPMRRRFCLAVMATLVLSFSFVAGQVLAEDGPDACLLFTEADASALFQESVSAGVPRAATSPAGASCRYSYNKNGDVFGMSLTHCTDASIAQEGIFDSAADVMMRQLRARQNSAHASTLLKIMPGLGDEAFWDGTSLWMRKGGHLVLLKPSPRLTGSFASMEAADAAKAERSRELAVQAAQIILPRLP